ncbi:hypothetical protein JR316_0007378 [Psilocybe cubensis]|uniref:Uncharacterized protein n=1 Tax=Psilocybe cubensis TaxID=181762 RepID=A0ACB8GZ19_PSICU|nr:hypothetical protein JR316_0007378 [Psilocybe cubensis]KAH9480778.1 hypothetical protein JR316_0007378 [Psilocybe cubensis]
MTSIFVNQAGDGGGGTQLQFYEAGDAFWKDPRYIPLLLSGIFSFSQLTHAVCSRFKYGRRPNEAAASTEERRGFLARWRWHIHLHGGYVIYAYMVARLVGSVALLYIFFTTAIADCEKAAGNNGWTFFPLCVQTALTIAHAYATLLAVTTFSLNFRPLAPARFHVTILCSILAIYAYRDIWPLANYGSVPKDQAEGNILWVKIALLVVTGVIIPLFIPHPYVPVDPKNPSPVPNPEQTASWISALTYTYADPIIILANKVAHLRHDQLPPLSDYDFAQYLSESAAKLSGKPSIRYRFFCKTLGLGLIHARVRLQAVLTQLFFEHSLRIRMKAETSNDGVESTPTPSEAGDNRSVVGGESIASGPNQSREDAESQITQASTAVGTTEASASTVQDNTPESSGQAKPQADEGPPVKKSSGDAENLIGKINNLVSTSA